MIPAVLSYERYRTNGAHEWMMRIGEPAAAPVLFVPPLFEEMNRTRALIAATMRGLAADGHCCWLPDLSGTGESMLGLGAVDWDVWWGDVMAASHHVAAAAGREPLVASIRGGALLDDAAAARCRWRFAPAAGASLARDMDRAALGGGAEWAGYHDAAPALREKLRAAVPADLEPLRTVRLATDAGPADAKVDGPALWRRSEPGTSTELAASLAHDIAEWGRTCAVS